ncbi:glycosyltransferase family 25 protein [Mesorhizobium sp. ZMM04-5]|uniref:Glycosyltransferase family 25 protein n=1 Tax=Mesorhizobium marinum TaxID=3228790 RepID=A0ABV3QVL7_9HYPH
MLAYYINLDSRPDRRAFMERQFAVLRLEVERLPATTPSTIEADDPALPSLERLLTQLSAPEIAISISHFRAWRAMLDQGCGNVLVLEDDLLLSGRLPGFLSELEREAFAIDILRLETHQTEVRIHPRAEPAPTGFAFHQPLSFESGCGAYVISATCAARILSSPHRFSMPLDDLLFSLASPFRRRNTIRTAVPALALFRFEVTAEFNVPESILISDAHAERVRLSEWKGRNKPTGLRRVSREVARLRRQAANLLPALWIRLVARTVVVPFAGDGLSEPPSTVRPRA